MACEVLQQGLYNNLYLCIFVRHSDPKSTLAIWSHRISIWKTTSQFHGSTFDFRRYMQFVINAVADLLQFFIRKCYSRWTLDNSTLILNKKKRTFKHDQMNAQYIFIWLGLAETGHLKKKCDFISFLLENNVGSTLFVCSYFVLIIKL